MLIPNPHLTKQERIFLTEYSSENIYRFTINGKACSTTTQCISHILRDRERPILYYVIRF